MDPVTLGLIMSAAPSVYQMFTAGKQKNMANNLKQSNFIPDSLKEVENMARAGASATRLPGQDAMESQIERGTANAVGNVRRASRSGTQLLENIGEINAQEGAAKMDLNKMLADFQTGERRNLQGILGQKANVELRNKDAYDAAKRNLLETSTKNTYGAISGLASAGISALPTEVANKFKGQDPMQQFLNNIDFQKLMSQYGGSNGSFSMG